MYYIDDAVSALKEVQRLLNINPTGIYDDNTTRAVIEVQSLYNLEKKRTVDYDTFNAIVKEHQKLRIKSGNQKYLFNPVFPYSVGDMGKNVGMINDLISLILDDYVYEGFIPKGEYLNKNTLTAANFLRKIFKMELSDNIDEAFLNRLLLEKNAIEIKRKYGK